MTVKHQSFEELTPKVLYDIMNIRLTVFVEEQGIMYVDTDYKDLQATHWMLYEGDTLVSYARVFEPGVIYESYYSIGRVATHKSYRNKGYATLLLNSIIEACDSTIKISAQYYLKAYYEKIGFKSISDSYIEEGIKHLAMIYTPR